MQEKALRVKARCRYPSFAFDITKLAAASENEIVVCAKDDNRSGRQPRGKQSEHFQSQGCDYTRTTGIWQTVWLKFVPDAYLRCVKYDPNLASKTLTIRTFTEGSGVLSAEAFFEGPQLRQSGDRCKRACDPDAPTVRASPLGGWRRAAKAEKLGAALPDAAK